MSSRGSGARSAPGAGPAPGIAPRRHHREYRPSTLHSMGLVRASGMNEFSRDGAAGLVFSDGYLRIIRVHEPTIFVMENVKGLLSSKHSGDPIFEKSLRTCPRLRRAWSMKFASSPRGGSSDSLEPTKRLVSAGRFRLKIEAWF